MTIITREDIRALANQHRGKTFCDILECDDAKTIHDVADMYRDEGFTTEVYRNPAANCGAGGFYLIVRIGPAH